MRALNEKTEKWVCPHCEAESDYLYINYTEYSTGTYYIESGDWDMSDIHDSEITHYYCPECDNEVSRPDV